MYERTGIRYEGVTNTGINKWNIWSLERIGRWNSVETGKNGDTFAIAVHLGEIHVRGQGVRYKYIYRYIVNTSPCKQTIPIVYLYLSYIATMHLPVYIFLERKLIRNRKKWAKNPLTLVWVTWHNHRFNNIQYLISSSPSLVTFANENFYKWGNSIPCIRVNVATHKGNFVERLRTITAVFSLEDWLIKAKVHGARHIIWICLDPSNYLKVIENGISWTYRKDREHNIKWQKSGWQSPQGTSTAVNEGIRCTWFPWRIKFHA